MIGYRVLGIAMILIGTGLLGPLSTRGQLYEIFRKAHTWFARLVGALLVLGGVVYVVHPPA